MLAAFAAAHPQRPLFAVSAVSGEGLQELTNAVAADVAATQQRLQQEPEFAAAEAQLAEAISADVLQQSLIRARARHAQRTAPADAGVEVIYAPEDP